MSAEQLYIAVVLVAALVLFAWGRWRYDVVALLALCATTLAGLVEPSQAFSGFGHPAVITVAAVLIISQALKESGVVEWVAQRLAPVTRSPLLHLIALTSIVAAASAFMNNVGALALMLPVALVTAAERDRSPALLLMPLAFGSILGGMTTMIGTPPNIIIATYRAEVGATAFGLFDFTPVGTAVAVIGVLFIGLLGWRLIPRERLSKNAPQQLFAIREYLTELRIPEGSKLIGESTAAVDSLDDEQIDLIGFAKGRGRAIAPPSERTLAQGDILIVRADPAAVQKLIDRHGFELLTSATPAFYDLTSGDLALAEGIVTSGSPLEGRDVPYLRRRTGGTVALVAIARQGRALRQRLRGQRFRVGDVLLLQGESESLDETITGMGLLPLAPRGLRIGQPRRVGLAVAIFAAAIVAGAVGALPTTLAFVLAILAYLATGVLPLRSLYEGVDWPVIVLLGALIPVGQSLEQTGATALFAGGVVAATGMLPAWAVLMLVLVATMILSDVINNAATALIMAPIAVGIAQRLDASTDAFLMAVAVGASCAFLTPIGHQSNTLVMGPGGYAFGDYWRMGLPLEVLIVVIATPMIVWVWGL